MFYLTIDVSSHVLVGVVEAAADDFASVALRSRVASNDSRHHVELLSPMVKQALGEAHVVRPDAIIAGTGPAAFTGLRAGLVTARTLAYTWDIPIYGISSAEVIALAAADRGANIVEAIIDARRKEVYALRARAMGSDDVEVLEVPRVLRPKALAQELDGNPAVVACARADLYADVLPDRIIVDAEPEVAVRLVMSRLARRDAGEAIDFSTEPQYLRRPDVDAGARAQPAAQGNPYGK
ncbi:MAG: tRNA (adenosine(37)-N6)-threonylcarbamoyltransferase complex dimerization subunit type 1 TsaB [Actinomycetaceae bacterium]|nr:tRNA (adenosine(37)-N6)-threonylcarbamoyltransferase complex dimerization subunit type 1 TsaB [Arcanobacterium sp.]MDD7505337.1 tRNA (adenosine(37)-N6)-threonylcarbamoyltransferase complex dimerization subunit type 1 TsaB [Actinomycetaceae bacterium]MDY6143935.1 tRNA (adenosine(37)-N6)-threonylcarbamoyltransferase complex dimerization subunit type 1 TsaB [Arcanobacterium sp.]